jgi:hypothetical protein
MNDFDLLLEFQLRHLLAPIQAAPVPARRKQPERPRAAYTASFDELTPRNLVAVPVEIFS